MRCPHCDSPNVRRKGTDITRAHGERRRITCKDCGRWSSTATTCPLRGAQTPPAMAELIVLAAKTTSIRFAATLFSRDRTTVRRLMRRLG